jgi:hypothetical protein
MDSLVIYAPGHDPTLPSYTLYNGQEKIWFDRSTWTTYRRMPDGIRQLLDGVTTVLHRVIDRSQPLMNWATKRTCEKLKRLLIERGYIGTDAPALYESILDEIITLARKAPDEELEEAANVGNIAHKFIESYIHACIEDNEERRYEILAKWPEDDRASNCVIAAFSFLSDHNVRLISTERKVMSREFNFAGTLDGDCLMDSCGNPGCPCSAFPPFVDAYCLLDWKSSNALRVDYVYQSAFYSHASSEESGKKYFARIVIRLGKDDAEFDPWFMVGQELQDEHFAACLHALELYRSLKKTEDWAGEVQAAKTEYKKQVAQAEKDAANQIACPSSSTYKGVKLKVGCNQSDVLCAKCAEIWQAKHAE